MSNADTVIKAVQTQLEEYSGLNYVRSFTRYEDEFELEDQGKFPWINLDIFDFRVEDAGSVMNNNHIERRVYPVVIQFSCRHKIKAEVKKGTGSFNGVLDIYDNIQAAIYTDLTYGGVTNRWPWRPGFSSIVSKHRNGIDWIGRAAIFYEVYCDVAVANTLGG